MKMGNTVLFGVNAQWHENFPVINAPSPRNIHFDAKKVSKIHLNTGF